ncbi:MAG: N-6 DNA methylase [Sandaracinaceae bacterium]|nr:N-6 DNA methylase [Sandaracinaceae bacterium]
MAPLLPALAGADGAVRALEPSAGIGRFPSAFAAHAPKVPAIRWQAVEYSKLSATLLQALFPDLPVFVGPFERWVADNDDERFDLVVANPPYGERGPAKTEDPDRSYRLPVDNAYAYFLRRTLDLLAPNGLGVLVIPSAFLTGTASEQIELRKLVLRRHHLAAAFRLPSGVFAGASARP